MARFRQKAFFTLEEAREAVLDPDSDNDFDNLLDLSSDEEYSDVELEHVEDDETRRAERAAERLRQEELRRLYEEDDFEDEIVNEPVATSSTSSSTTDPAPDVQEAESDDVLPTPTATGLDGDGDGEVSVTVRGSSKGKRRRVAVPAAAAAAWNDDPKQDPQLLDFTGTPGVNPLCGLTDKSTPLDCYMKFVSAETFDDVAVESNRYASAYLAEHPPSPSSPSQKWTRTTGGLYDLLFMTITFITNLYNVQLDL